PLGIYGSSGAERNVTALRRFFHHCESNLDAIGNSAAIRCVMQVQRDVASRSDQLCSVEGAVVGYRVTRKITIFRRPSRPAAGCGRTKRRSFVRKSASIFAARFVDPDGLKVFDVRSVRVKTQADVVRNGRILGLDLNRSDPSVFLKSGRDSD